MCIKSAWRDIDPLSLGTWPDLLLWLVWRHQHGLTETAGKKMAQTSEVVGQQREERAKTGKTWQLRKEQSGRETLGKLLYWILHKLFDSSERSRPKWVLFLTLEGSKHQQLWVCVITANPPGSAKIMLRAANRSGPLLMGFNEQQFDIWKDMTYSKCVLLKGWPPACLKGSGVTCRSCNFFTQLAFFARCVHSLISTEECSSTPCRHMQAMFDWFQHQWFFVLETNLH